jgi:hypothetical protein
MKDMDYPKSLWTRATTINAQWVLELLRTPRAESVIAHALDRDGLLLLALGPLLVEAKGSALTDGEKKLAGEAVAFDVEKRLKIGRRTQKRTLYGARATIFRHCMHFERVGGTASPIAPTSGPVPGLPPADWNDDIALLLTGMASRMSSSFLRHAQNVIEIELRGR